MGKHGMDEVSLALMFRDKSEPLSKDIQFLLDLEMFMVVSKKGADRLEVFKLAMEGANISAQSTNEAYPGWTPLMFAVEHHNRAVLEVLAHLKADPNPQNGDGDTALMIALRKGMGHEFLREYLFEGGLNLNLRNKAGETALIIALKNQNLDDANCLINYGATTVLYDSDGRRAIDYARAIPENYTGRQELIAKIEALDEKHESHLAQGMPTDRKLPVTKPPAFKK